jgi:hypothetical protein
MTEGRTKSRRRGPKRHHWRIDPEGTDEAIDAWPSHFVETVLGPPSRVPPAVDPLAPLSTVSWTELIFDIKGRLDEFASAGGGYLVLNVDRPGDPFVRLFVVFRTPTPS